MELLVLFLSLQIPLLFRELKQDVERINLKFFNTKGIASLTTWNDKVRIILYARDTNSGKGPVTQCNFFLQLATQ